MTLLYLIGYGYLLVSSNFVPYVFDNNESFSAFVHARNLIDFSLTQSFGLADEALGPSAAAHPFVYTHGGNFPRLFAALLDVVGITTPEGQIAVTTFGVGLAGLFLTYHYFHQVSSALFASTACFVLISDYVLFAQWQVNTWRVWHGLFLFGALLCAHRIASRRSSSRILTLLVGIGVAYFELIFGAFVVAFAALYAAVLFRHQLRLLVEYVALLTVGALAGFVALTVQRVGYLGWADALTDTYLTYFARLGEDAGPSALEPLRIFYDSHHIAFWYNLVDPRAFHSPGAFIEGLFQYSFGVHTPLFSSLVLVLLAGLLAAAIRRPSLVDGFAPSMRLTIAKVALLAVGCWVLLIVAFSGDLALGSPPNQQWPFVLWDGRRSGLLAATVGCVVMTAGLVRASGGWMRFGRLPWQSVVITAALLLGIALFVRLQYRLYSENFSALWLALGSGWLPGSTSQLALPITAAVAAALSLRGSCAFSGGREVGGIVRYLVCGFLAYTVLYALAAGYVMTGYVTRHAPLLVFIVDIAVALALYVVLTLAIAAVGSPLVTRLVAASVCVFMVGYWTHLQFAYLNELPASLFGVLRTLADSPYRGRSFVDTNYAAPLAAFTGQWAYYDPVIGDAVSTAGYVLARDTRYLWQADRAINSTYFKPDYFMCFLPETLSTLVERLKAPDGKVARCSRLALVRAAMATPGYPHQLVARDESGHDAWAIVKLDPAHELMPGEHAAPPPQGDIVLGSNWYPYEVFAGESFHWVTNDAELIVTGPSSGSTALRLDLAPGPGLGRQDFILEVIDEHDTPVANVPVVGRASIRLELPVAPAETATYRLHVEGGGRSVVGDPRTLNFRVFSIDWDLG